VVAGWGIAQNPLLLRDLTVSQAAASHSTLVAVIVAVVAGGIVLFPSLALLFRLVLGGRLGHGAAARHDLRPVAAAPAGSGLAPRLAIALAVAGFGLLTIADAPWAHAIGATSFLGFIVAGVAAVRPAELAAEE